MHTCVELLSRTSTTIATRGPGLCLVLALAGHACGAPKVLPDARIGEAYEYAVVHQGLVEPVKAEWRGLPDWLAADGPRIHGTPRAVTPKPLEFSVILTGQLGSPLQGQFRLSVQPAIRPLAVVKSALPPLPLGEPVSIWFAADGGEGKLSWEVRWIARSPGVEAQIDGELGACRLVGVPTTEGRFQIQVIVRDEAGAADQHLFEGSARAFATPLRIVTGEKPLKAAVELPQATLSYPYFGGFTAEGGRPPYRWRVQWQAAAPPGLTVTADEGRVVGIPTHLGDYPFVVTLVDTAGTQKQASGSLTVAPPKCDPFLLPQDLPAATVGRPFEATLCAGGLIGNTKWTVTGAPSWLRWENSGQIACRLSAVPPESGTWDVAIKLSMTVPAQTRSGESVQEIGNASRVFKLHVAPKNVPPLKFIELHPPVAVQDQRYEYCFATEGGELPVTLTFSGNLPDSITTSPRGTIATAGIPRPGVFPFTVTATSADGQTRTFSPELRVIPAHLPTPLTLCDAPGVNGLLLQESVWTAPVHGGVPPYTLAVESCRGMKTLASRTADSLAFRLHHPFGARAQIAVQDSAGQTVTGSVDIHPVVRLEYVVLAFVGLLLMHGGRVYSARLRQASKGHPGKR